MMEQRPVRASTNRSRAQLADLLAARPGRRTINEYDSNRLLSGFGVPGPRDARVATIAEAKSAARELGYPVVLKAVSDDVAHKTELGLVAVGLKNDEELAHAFAQLSERLDRFDPPPSDRAFLCRSSSPTASNSSPASRPIPISACRLLSARAAPPSKSPPTL